MRVSTASTHEVETPRRKAGALYPQHQDGRRCHANKTTRLSWVVGLKGFWGNPWNPKIIDELAAPDILLRFSLHAPRRGRDDVRDFMVGFRKAFPDLNFWGAADLI